MPKFDTRKLEAVNAKEPVEELLIDGVSALDSYENSLETRYLSEYKTILKYIEYAANGSSLPKTKMRKYGGSNGVTEYEFKSEHLRVWAIQQPGKKLVVHGGFKNSQDADESRFWSLKKQYLESLKINTNNGKKGTFKK